MDLDAYFAENPMGGSFPTNPDFKSGFVTLVGRPNAGKKVSGRASSRSSAARTRASRRF